MKTTAAILALALLIGLPALKTPAGTLGGVRVTCPVCGYYFSTLAQTSGFIVNTRLDTKPVGHLAVPWPIPVCYRCGFVVFTVKLTPAQKTSLKKYLATARYKRLAGNHPSYYRLARIFKYLVKDDLDIAHLLLKASWQVERDIHDKNKRKWTKYMEEALWYFNITLAKRGIMDRDTATAALLAGEIERRLGMFDAAKRRFKKLGDLPRFQSGIMGRIVRYQLKLIEKNDSQPHVLP